MISVNKDMQRKFVSDLKGSEMHWFFVQGIEAYATRLYVPSVSALLNGIEATLRFTVHQLDTIASASSPEPPLRSLLSNFLIRQARSAGMPVQCLAFPGESDFSEKLDNRDGSGRNVEVVRVRHNICHGNVIEFVNTDLGDGNHFFTPECLKSLNETLIEMSVTWCDHLGRFRQANL